MKQVWMILGFVCLAIGTLGIALPILPTVPFYMATVFCFAKSSRRLHDWFIGTKLYRNHMEQFVRNRAMTRGTKIRLIATVTIIMGIGFACMSRAPIGQIILAIVWICHMIYFVFGIDTIPPKEDSSSE